MLKYNLMNMLFKNVAKRILTFLSEQYLAVIFSLTTGIKLFFISTYVVRLTWSSYYLSGVIVSLFSAFVLFLPLYFIKKYKKILAITVSSFVSIILVIDIVYYSYFSSLPTVGLLSAAGQTSDITSAILPLIKWWLPLYFIDIVFVLAFKRPIGMFFKKIKERFSKSSNHNILTSFIVSGLMILSLIVSLPMGFSKLNEVINRGYDTVSTAQYYGILMAHAIDITRFIKQETISISEEKKQEIIDWVNLNKKPQVYSGLNSSAKNKNVILIQVESLGAFVLNQTVNNKEITPNLNRLAESASFFPNSHFVMGAGHTSDTDFVSNTSYFPLNDAAVFVRYGQSNFTSLAKTLTSNNYSAYAYHGYNRNFWNRNVALGSLGYQKYFAADNYSDGQKMNMGLNDGDFLMETIDYIKDQPRPSLSYVITLTSHTPFHITNETKELGLKSDDYPNQVAGYLENINYTDRMLGKFFDKLKEYNLYDDSLIVIYGDHVPVLDNFSAGTIEYNPKSKQGQQAPIIIKLPNQKAGKIYNDYGTHLDITPTVFDLLGVKTNQLMFGQSLFADERAVCKDQFANISISSGCDEFLDNAKYYSSLIIKYNQFNNL